MKRFSQLTSKYHLGKILKSHWTQAVFFAALTVVGALLHMPTAAVSLYGFVTGFELCVAMHQAREKALRDFVALVEADNTKLLAELTRKRGVLTEADLTHMREQVMNFNFEDSNVVDHNETE